MSKLRSLNTAFWSDTWIEELKPSEKLLYLYLITNERTNMLGIYELSMGRICFETGLDSRTVSNALEAFQRVGKVDYRENYVILKNYLKHQKYNPNMQKAAIDVYNELPESIKIQGLTEIKSRDSKGFESLSKGLGMVRKVEVEVEYEEEDELIEEKKPSKFNFRKRLLDEGGDDQLVSDWMKVRKTKKATNTETALKTFLNEVKKSGKPLNDVLKRCAEKSWSGFNASWPLEDSSFNQQPQSTEPKKSKTYGY